MNNLNIIGNLVKDPEMRATETGKTICKFTVAVNRGKDEEPDFFNVIVWEHLADICGQYLAKGRKVAVTGSVSLRRYTTKSNEKRAYLEVRANSVEFISGEKKTPQTADFAEIQTDEIPF